MPALWPRVDRFPGGRRPGGWRCRQAFPGLLPSASDPLIIRGKRSSSSPPCRAGSPLGPPIRPHPGGAGITEGMRGMRALRVEGRSEYA